MNLQTHIADPLRRLRAIREAAGAVKAMVRRAKGIMPTDLAMSRLLLNEAV